MAERIGTLLYRSGDGGEEVLIVSRGKVRTRFRRRDELDWSLRVESTDSENIVEGKPDPKSARRASRPRGQRVAYVRVSAADQNEARQLEAVGECDRVYIEKQSARSRADRVKLEECIRYLQHLGWFGVDLLGEALRVQSIVQDRGVLPEELIQSEIGVDVDRRDSQLPLRFGPAEHVGSEEDRVAEADRLLTELGEHDRRAIAHDDELHAVI